jgi:hypothetical protein
MLFRGNLEIVVLSVIVMSIFITLVSIIGRRTEPTLEEVRAKINTSATNAENHAAAAKQAWESAEERYPAHERAQEANASHGRTAASAREAR